MHKYFIYTIIVISLLSEAFSPLYAQNEEKRELRATWVASVSNIDWPESGDRGNAEAQKTDLIEKLELYQSVNLNAIFLQVRPECDALYNSSYEPWSRYLTWAQGDDPGYDPLQFAIEEAHKRGIEVHAWMNPYRLSATTSPGTDYFDSEHVYVEHPEWAMIYSSGKMILNPGLPEVMAYIGSVVRDLCSNYNVDGVHFDDYFYSYEGTDAELDADEYALYGGSMSLSDWRRDNVNRMIDTVYRNIQEVNPDIRFGVSPFGIYKPGYPSGISGMNAWSQIYCDPLAWLEDQNLDYLTPQLYWPTGGSQDFESLANWWADQVDSYDRHLYTGHGSYRLDDNPDTKSFSIKSDTLHENKQYFDIVYTQSGEVLDLSALETDLKKSTDDPVSEWTLSEIGLQIDIVRSRYDDGGLGGVFFSATDFERVSGFAEYLVANKYTHPAIVPEMSWKTDPVPDAPETLKQTVFDGARYLEWSSDKGPNDRFAIYASASTQDSSQIIIVADNLKAVVFEDSIALGELDFSNGSYLCVTAISATGKESLPSSPILIDGFPEAILDTPADETIIGQDDILSWHGSEENLQFKLQNATNYNFSDLNYDGDWGYSTSYNISSLDLEGESTYYWRVKAKNTEGEESWSEYRNYTTGFPATPEILYPVNLSLSVNTVPTIKWDASTAASTIVVEISETSSFDVLIVNESFDAADGKGLLGTELELEEWYYIRIKAVNAYGDSQYSDSYIFETTSGPIPEVQLESPVSGTMLASFDEFSWTSTISTGNISYYLEVSIDEDFQSTLLSTGWIDENSLVASLLDLEGQRTYYWRVMAKNENGEGEYSDIWEFTTSYPSRPTLTAPAQLSDDNNVQVEISWDENLLTDSVYVQFSEDSDFETIDYDETFLYSPLNAQTTHTLKEYTWYFVRAAAKNDYGYSVFSASKYFQTGISNSISEEEGNNASVQISPNPLKKGENLNLKLININSEKIEIKIINSFGQFLFQKEFSNYTGNEISIQTDKITGNGIYFAYVICGNKIYVQKFVILK